MPLTHALMPSPQAEGTLLRCDSELVGVREVAHGRHLVAIRQIPAGTRVLTLTGRETSVPTRYSVQVGRSLHLDQDCAHDDAELFMRYFWRYLDHHCDPTAVLRGRELFALRDIAHGEGVTFDYNTTEYDMAAPFACHCDSVHCVGVVRGARHLTPVQRARRARWIASHLR